MVRVAIAGATGGLGRTFIDGFVEDGQHELFALTRKPTDTFNHQPTVTVLPTNYSSESDLKQLLEHHEIHTIICVFNPCTEEVNETQQRLMRAAAESSCVKRFMPSEFALDYDADDEQFPLFWKPLKRSSRNLLRSLPLEYLLVHNGYLMDYFGLPYLPSHMLPEISWVDISARCAGIPGDGTAKVTWTHTIDLAKFLVRLCSEPEGVWKEMGEKVEIVGGKVSFNDVVEIAKSVRDGDGGNGKQDGNDSRKQTWKVDYSTLEELRMGKLVEIPAYEHLYELFGGKEGVLGTYAGFGCYLAMGLSDYDESSGRSLNKRYHDIKTRKVREVIEEAWQGR